MAGREASFKTSPTRVVDFGRGGTSERQGLGRCGNPRWVAPSRRRACMAWGWGQTDVDRDSEAPAGGACVVLSAKRVRGGPAKSEPRRPLAGPGRVNPRGASGTRRAKHTFGREGLRQGAKPRNRGPSDRPVASAAGTKAGETVCGRSPVVTSGYLAGGESSEGRIPGAPPARNKAGTGSRGESRRGGNQTPGAERSGQAKPA